MDCIVHGIAESDTTELLSLSPLPITVIFCSGRLELSWIISWGSVRMAWSLDLPVIGANF